MGEIYELISLVPLNLSLTEVEDTMLKLMTSFPPERSKQIEQLITREQLLKFLTFGAEIFRLGSTLDEFVVRDRCVVVSDLHGSLDDLIVVLLENGPPPDMMYLFLGDYVGRGRQQIEVFLIIMLMKLRWPKHVHMLRGSHESSEECAENTFFDACMDAYNDRKICALFSQIFDYMPIAAIVNDKIFCCHGGISQWMTSRDAIRTIKRPIVLYSMSVLQSCLFTDLLWADPAPRQKIPFQVSPRRCSYTFNADGLNAALQHINCEALLRGNEDTENGICVNFPNKCITVHTTNSQAPSHVRGAYLTIAKRNDRLDIDCATHSLILNSVQQIQKAEYAKVMTDFVYSFKKLKYEEYFRRLSRKNLVEHVIVNTVAEAHYVTPDTMRTWLSTYAIREMGYLPAFYGSVKNSVWDYATYFPVLYDAVKGLRSTFRVILTDDEKLLLQKMSVLPSTFDLPVFYQDWPHEPFENKKPKEQDIQSRIKSLSHVWEPFAERH